MTNRCAFAYFNSHPPVLQRKAPRDILRWQKDIVSLLARQLSLTVLYGCYSRIPEVGLSVLCSELKEVPD